MGIGDPATPVGSGVEINNPVTQAVIDQQKGTDRRLVVLERAGNTDLIYQVRWLYDFLGEPYPPP